MVADEFREEIDPTIEDFYRCILNIDNKIELLEIFDTYALEDCMSLNYLYYTTVVLFVLVYSISSLASFYQIKYKYNKIGRHQHKEFDVILVGNKCDLSDNVKFHMKWVRI